jgi:hypothetical protein
VQSVFQNNNKIGADNVKNNGLVENQAPNDFMDKKATIGTKI